jgi:hypothetical protein
MHGVPGQIPAKGLGNAAATAILPKHDINKDAL